MIKDFLPFPRGMTASAGLSGSLASGSGLQAIIPTATGAFLSANQFRPDLATCQAEVYSNTTLSDPIGGIRIKLRCVQAAADITVARKFVTFSQTAKLFGIVTTDPGIPSSGTAGLCALAIDHAYAVGTVIKKWDWFWCIEEGPAIILAGTTTVAQGATMCDANGAAAPATAGLAVVGTADQVVSANASNLVNVWMTPLYCQKSDAAG